MDWKKIKGQRMRVVDLANRESVKQVVEDLRAKIEVMGQEIVQLSHLRRTALMTISALVAEHGEDGTLRVSPEATAQVTGAEHVNLQSEDITDDEGKKVGWAINIAVRQATTEEREHAKTTVQQQKEASRIIVPSGVWKGN